MPVPVLNEEKKRLSKLEERREARVRAPAGGSGDSDSTELQLPSRGGAC